jgi:hypothetical protein
MPFVSGLLVLARSDRCPQPRDIARTRAIRGCRRNSLPRSVSTRRSLISCSSKNGSTRSLSRSAAVIGVLRLVLFATVSPWSRRAVDICQLDTYRPDTCQSGPCQPEAPEEAAPCAADRRRRQRSAWPRMQPLRLEFSASSILSCLDRVSGKAVNAAPVRRPADSLHLESSGAALLEML